MVAPNINSKTDPEDRDYWATPNEIYRGALRYFVSKGMLPAHATYEVDVCANKHNAKHRRFIDEETDGTKVIWQSNYLCYPDAVAWCNPPYSRGSKEGFISKAICEMGYSANTIMLLPADTSAKWFSECVKHAKAVAFICNGRISFINNKTGLKVHGSNTGSILVLFAPRDEEQKVARTFYVTKQKLEELGKDD